MPIACRLRWRSTQQNATWLVFMVRFDESVSCVAQCGYTDNCARIRQPTKLFDICISTNMNKSYFGETVISVRAYRTVCVQSVIVCRAELSIARILTR